jgi:outer membrane protein OmpA-like peptidoglycan-associated protein
MIDPNRSYNRDEINRKFKTAIKELHAEALENGAKLEVYDDQGKARAVCKDVYTGKELLGGDEINKFEYDHIRSSAYIHNKYKGILPDDEIAELVNCRGNIGATHKSINRSKGKLDMENLLDNSVKSKKLGIDEKITKSSIQAADLAIERKVKEILKRRMSVADTAMTLSSLNNASTNSYRSNSVTSNSFKLKALPYQKINYLKNITINRYSGALLILCLFTVFLWTQNIFPFEKNTTNTLKLNSTKITANTELANDIKSLLFQNPLDTLTKSITEINKFEEMIKNKNMIPVTGVIFEFNSSDLTEKGTNILKEFTSNYKKIKVKNYLLIEGYSCYLGEQSYNIELSKNRALSIQSELIKFGVTEDLIKIKPVGKTNFVASKDPQNDLKINRRSNVTIIPLN